MFLYWVEAFHCRGAMALTVGKSLLQRKIPVWGIPSESRSNWGMCFPGQTTKSICNMWLIIQYFHRIYHPQSPGLVEKNNNTIKPQLAKFSEAFNLPWTKALPLFSSTLGKHQLSPSEIINRWSMHLDEVIYEPLLKGDILNFCQRLKVLKEDETLVNWLLQKWTLWIQRP